MTALPFLLALLCLIVLGAAVGKPLGYVAIGLAVLAMLLQVGLPR